MLTQGIGLLILTLLAKIAGFFRDVVLSYFYGASTVVDAYVIATTIPMVVFSFIGTGIETSLIPMLHRVKSDGEDEERFVSNIENVFLLVCAIIIIVIELFPKPIVKLFASGFNDETLSIAMAFTRFSIIGIVFSTLIYIYSSVLHHKNKFVAAAFSTILMDCIVLFFVILSNSFGIFLLPIGNVAAFCIQAIFLRLFIKYHHYFFVNLNDKYLREIIKIIIPVVIGASVNQINLLIDQTLASRIMTGGIAYLNYANKVLGVVQGVFILSFVSLLFPKMTEICETKNLDILVAHIKKWSIILQFLLIPCTILFCIYSTDVIRFLFERGEFLEVDTYYTARVLLCYALELPFYGLREVLSRAYYAHGNTRLPMINSIIGLIINVLISVLLALKYGLIGLPLGTAISCLATACFILIQFKRDFCKELKSNILKNILIWDSIFLVSGLLIVLLVKNFIKWENNFSFIIESFFILIIYFGINGFIMIKAKIIQFKVKEK